MAWLLWKPAWQCLTSRCIFLILSRNVTPIYSRKVKLMFTQKPVCECWQCFISNHPPLKTTQISCGMHKQPGPSFQWNPAHNGPFSCAWDSPCSVRWDLGGYSLHDAILCMRLSLQCVMRLRRLLIAWCHACDSFHITFWNVMDLGPLSTKVHIVKAMAFPVVMYRCGSWVTKKAEHRRIDVFKLWCWRRLLRLPLDCKQIKWINPKGNQPWIFIGRTDAEDEAPVRWPFDAKSQSIGKDPDAGKDIRQKEKRGQRMR